MRIDVEVSTTLSVLDFYAQIGAFVSFELIHIVIILLGGIALFLFGMQLMGDGLKKVAGGKLEVILYRLSNTPLKGVLLGTGVTAIIQSSSATSVMVVGFVNAGMIKMKQAIGIIMGAIIGTSVTGWVLCLSDISGGAGGFELPVARCGGRPLRKRGQRCHAQKHRACQQSGYGAPDALLCVSHRNSPFPAALPESAISPLRLRHNVVF